MLSSMATSFARKTMMKFNVAFQSTYTQVDFGKSAVDYGKYRHGLPLRFFDELAMQQVAIPGSKILDIGTGTGDIARNLANRGCKVTAIDPAKSMIEQAKAMDANKAVDVTYEIATAEKTHQQDNCFDAVTAVQAYHWFDSAIALPEIIRVLKKNGQFVIASYDWKSGKDVSLLSESLVRAYNPDWVVLDFYKKPYQDLCALNFRDIRVVNFMQKEFYSHEAWVGRASTFYGMGPSLPAEKVVQFKKELKHQLKERFPEEPLEIMHKCHILTARRPSFFKAGSELERDLPLNKPQYTI